MSDLRSIHIPLELWGAFFCTLTTLCVLFHRNIDKRMRAVLAGLQISNVILLVADAFAWYFRGDVSMAGYVWVRVSNFTVFEMNYVMLALFSVYLFLMLSETHRRAVRKGLFLILGICAAYTVCLILSQWLHWFYYFDENNRYHRADGYGGSMIFGLVGMIVLLIIMIRFREDFSNHVCAAMVSYALIPVVCTGIQALVYGIAILNIGITIANLFVFITFEIQQSWEMLRMEQELSNMRVEVLLAQIKPHFLFNILTTIKYLCRTDPEQAEQTLDELSVYLRQNVDAMAGKNMVPMEEELRHVNNYFLLEKRRFENPITIEYNLCETQFQLPSFTLQPLVENAIRHGILPKKTGGRIRITTRRMGDSCFCVVEDDGIGFDADALPQDGRRHVGIDNVRKRLEMLCDGSITITGGTDGGCRVVIEIRQRDGVRKGKHSHTRE